MDMTEGQERCTKQSVRIVKKNVKFPLSLEMAVPFTAKNVTRSVKIAAAK